MTTRSDQKERPAPTTLDVNHSMKRRKFLQTTSRLAVIMATNAGALSTIENPSRERAIDAGWFGKSRRFADLPMSRVAYVEHGRGPAALFIHG